jgi:Protein of unknown function (DUF3054)
MSSASPGPPKLDLPPPPSKKSQWLNLDAIAVVVFVAIGRDNHAEGLDLQGLGRTAAPFMIGAAVGWLISSAWKRPADLRTGLIVWASTLAVGMVLRRLVFDKGTAVAFVVVATVFLGVTFLGWRLVHRLVVSRLVRETPP